MLSTLPARFLLIAGGNFLRQFAIFIAQLVVAERCGASTFGLVAMAFAWSLLMVGLGDFGTRLFFWRTIAVLPAAERANAAHKFVWQHLAFSLWPIIPLNLVISLTTSGTLATLLHLYTLSCVFNQAAFDWWFFCQERYVSLFVFNVASGLLLLLFSVGFIHAPRDSWVFALATSLSFGLPGILLTVFGRPLPSLSELRGIIQIPTLAKKYLSYDWAQRAYTSFPPLLAAIYFTRAEVGQFRVAFLFYGLVFTVASYLGSAVFNQIARVSNPSLQQTQLIDITRLLVLFIVPYSAVAGAAANFVVMHYMSKNYAPALDCLNILMPFLIVPAAANFLREAIVGAGRPLVSMWSYLITIATASLGAVAFHSDGILGMSWALLGGETLGLCALFPALSYTSFGLKTLWQMGLAILGYFLVERFILAFAGPWNGHPTSVAITITIIATAALVAAAPIFATLGLEKILARPTA